LKPALERLAAPTEEDLYNLVGRGKISPGQILDVIFPGLKESDRAAATATRRIEGGKSARLYVRGGGLTPGISLHFGTCCTPVPGDRIVGIVEPDSGGLTVHAIDCAKLAEYEDREELWRDLQWTPEAERNTVTLSRLTATIRNAPGVLGQACTVIGEAGGNIVNLRMHRRQADFFDVDFDVEVKDARHLTNIAAALRANPSIETVERAKG
jgi:GTP pyrophosphokinase/guanosine-3',5'-bis(diphosphate) 3'-pyrophosphohydrolase